MKLLFSRGTFTLSFAFAASASAAIDADAVSAADVEGRPLNGRGTDLRRDRDDMNMNMPSFEHYDSGSIKTLLVSYRDEAAHGNVVAHTTAMESQGRAIKESSNIVFSKPHKISGKAGKARRARGLQDDQADDFAKGISFVKVDTTSENYEAEVAALKNIEGVSSVEEDSLVHIYSNFKEHQQNLRGVKAADHISEIQDAMKAATDALPVPEDDIVYSPRHEGRGRRLAEEVPYGIDMVNASWVWDQDQPAAMADPIKICVVDTGYDSGHPDLPTEDEHNVIGWHEGIGTDDSPYGEWNIDGHGHGTHCAGTIGAIGGNDIGVTSVNPDPSKFQFIIGKGLGDWGSGNTSNLLETVKKCVEMGAKVISMSLGAGGVDSASNAIYEEIYDQGVLIIAAAGNGGNSAYSYPASYPVVMSVGSIDSTRVRASFSQHNDQVEIAAPGVGVQSTIPDNEYASWSGTSFAAPHVAGVAALLWSHFPDCTNNQIRNAMIQSAADPPTDSDGWNSEYGWGIVNAGHAYELLKTGCETAGGVGTPLNGQELSQIANGGKDQKNEGCTLDVHCDQPKFCHTDTSECVVTPPTPTPAPGAPCPSGHKKYQVTVTGDNYPSETSYTLKNLCSNETILEGSDDEFDTGVAHVSPVVCAAAERMQFVIKDSFGDGICCIYGSGSYEVTEGDEVVASGGQFGSEDDTTFGWEDCGNPPPIAPPTSAPTTSPTVVPTSPPTTLPTVVPTSPPTAAPTNTNAPTPNPTVPVTPLPTIGDNAVAQEAVYDTTLSVPRCANTGSSCDSLSLLKGKGSMTNGQEPNASNTNKFGQVCNDGNAGSYHNGESIDQITVTAGDLDAKGNPSPSGDFIVEGGRAYVTVKLWCWGTGASNHADLYLSSAASSPDWQLLTTITCPGGGGQKIMHAFDVPSGNDQSIRVNFRYGGTTPSTCSNGKHDDHDDLVFAVKSSEKVISVRSNAMTSMIASGRDKRHDEVQGAIVEMQHDKIADEAAAALVQLNGSIRTGNAEDGSSSSNKSKEKSKFDKEAGVSANAVSATSKYVCARSTHLSIRSSVQRESNKMTNAPARDSLAVIEERNVVSLNVLTRKRKPLIKIKKGVIVSCFTRLQRD